MVTSTLGIVLLFLVLKLTNKRGRVVISEAVDLVENRQSYGAVGNPVGKGWAARCPILINRIGHSGMPVIHKSMAYLEVTSRNWKLL